MLEIVCAKCHLIMTKLLIAFPNGSTGKGEWGEKSAIIVQMGITIIGSGHIGAIAN